MGLKTTCIGAYPKPSYVKLPDWFNIPAGPDTADPTKQWLEAMEELGPDANAIIAKGIKEAVTDQTYHCRHLNGFDFENLTNKQVRGGTYSANLPTIRSAVTVKKLFLADDWKLAQSFSQNPLKITMPGPMTVFDTNCDDYYNDPEKAGHDIAKALNQEVLSLAEAGCKYIQIDEPLFARKPKDALDYGFENLETTPTTLKRIRMLICKLLTQ